MITLPQLQRVRRCVHRSADSVKIDAWTARAGRFTVNAYHCDYFDAMVTIEHAHAPGIVANCASSPPCPHAQPTPNHTPARQIPKRAAYKRCPALGRPIEQRTTGTGCNRATHHIFDCVKYGVGCTLQKIDPAIRSCITCWANGESDIE